MKFYEIKNKKAFTSVEYIVIVVLALLVLGIMFSTYGKQQSYADRILIMLGLKANNIDRSFNQKCGFEVSYIDLVKEKVKPDNSCSLIQNGKNNSWVCLGTNVFLFFKIGVLSSNEKTLILYPVAIVEKCEDEYFTKCKKINELGSLGSTRSPSECSVKYLNKTSCVISSDNLNVDLVTLKKDVAYYRIKPKVEAAKDTCGTNKIETAQKDDNMIFVTVYKDLSQIKKSEDCLAIPNYYSFPFAKSITIDIYGRENNNVVFKASGTYTNSDNKRTTCYDGFSKSSMSLSKILEDAKSKAKSTFCIIKKIESEFISCLQCPSCSADIYKLRMRLTEASGTRDPILIGEDPGIYDDSLLELDPCHCRSGTGT